MNKLGLPLLKAGCQESAKRLPDGSSASVHSQARSSLSAHLEPFAVNERQVRISYGARPRQCLTTALQRSSHQYFNRSDCCCCCSGRKAVNDSLIVKFINDLNDLFGSGEAALRAGEQKGQLRDAEKSGSLFRMHAPVLPALSRLHAQGASRPGSGSAQLEELL